MNRQCLGLVLLLPAVLTLTHIFPAELVAKYSLEVVEQSEHEEKPSVGQEIKLHYDGTLEDGTEFDSSYKRREPLPIRAGSGQVIKCWDEVTMHIPVGWKIRVLCPYDTAYGDRAIGSLPARANLNFLIERVA